MGLKQPTRNAIVNVNDLNSATGPRLNLVSRRPAGWKETAGAEGKVGRRRRDPIDVSLQHAAARWHQVSPSRPRQAAARGVSALLSHPPWKNYRRSAPAPGIASEIARTELSLHGK